MASNTSTITAPIAELMIARKMPVPRLTPRNGSSQPATTAPTMPIDDVADQAEAAAAHEQSGEPAGDRADQQPDDDGIDPHDNPRMNFAQPGVCAVRPRRL